MWSGALSGNARWPHHEDAVKRHLDDMGIVATLLFSGPGNDALNHASQELPLSRADVARRAAASSQIVRCRTGWASVTRWPATRSPRPRRRTSAGPLTPPAMHSAGTHSAGNLYRDTT